MPHKSLNDLEIAVPEWLDAIEDSCLYETLVECLVARDAAIRAGARERRATKRALNAADETLDQIRLGRYRGQIACRKAATALRKYTQALDGTQSHAA